MILETLTTTVGGAAARTLLTLWLRDSAMAREVGLSISQMIGKRVTGTLDRRRMMREFDRISEEIAARLAPLWETEFEGLEANEQRAAAIAVAATVDGAALTEDVLFANDIDPVMLEGYFRSTKPTAADDALLAPAAVALYDAALREVCHYLVEIVVTLPSFDSREARELLKRETELIHLVQKVLERLPDNDDAGRFETAYRRELVRKFDKLELFGVTASELSSRYSLSVAYLMLDVSRAPSEAEEDAAEASDDGDRPSVSVDQALGRTRRSLLRGEAGSGKTTVLQWLAVTAARREFGEALEIWNDTVPFLLKLRRFVASGLPQPSDFIAQVNPSLAEGAPPGWIQSQLESGRALVLIDGVDELPETQREGAREWLRDLIATYPYARYVVTSRPPAVSEDWLSADGFEASFLEPMDPAGIRSFIAHWHGAARAELRDPEAIEDLQQLEAKLQKEVRERKAVRDLATSPLLCALLCALNRDRRAQLPGDRLKLYAIALEMLLDRRENERGVIADLDVGDDERKLILSDLAFWLLGNEMSDAERDQVIARIEVRIEGMHRIQAPAETVYKHLLHRSGLIREPIEGRVDFIHRTFQEYLGAREAMRGDWVKMLVDKAHLDQWREVVVLGAGLGSFEQRENLISGLLVRADGSRTARHRLQLLAVACLETSPELPPELADRLQQVLHDLIPPSTLTEARALASAGDLAVAPLAENGKGRVSVTAATVRALGLIGGEAALAGLERYGPDSRVTVGRELVRAWDFFPIDAYARRVLARSVLDNRSLDVDSGEKLAAVGRLQKLATLRVHGGQSDCSGWDWAQLVDAPRLTHLSLTEIDGSDTAPPYPLPQLKRLTISHSKGLARLGELGPELEALSVFECGPLDDLSALSGATGLKQLSLHGVRTRALPPLPASLVEIDLYGMRLTSLSGLETATATGSLAVHNCPELTSLDAIGSLPVLKSLSLSDCPKARVIGPLGDAGQLRRLWIHQLALPDPSPLGELTKLTHLGIATPDYLGSFDWLRTLPDVETLSLIGCKFLNDVDALSQLLKLRALNLTGSRGLRTLDGLDDLTELTTVNLSNCELLIDISALARLRKLTHVRLRRCMNLKDLTPLADLPDLVQVDLRGCARNVGVDQLDESRVEILRGPAPAYVRDGRAIVRYGVNRTVITSPSWTT